MLRPPPISTLFPYTTLFRSHRASSGAGERGAFARRFGIRGQSIRANAPRDRKSTRLNSSHVKISYAVFCLKKKIKYEPRTKPRTQHRTPAPEPAQQRAPGRD